MSVDKNSQGNDKILNAFFCRSPIEADLEIKHCPGNYGP